MGAKLKNKPAHRRGEAALKVMVIVRGLVQQSGTIEELAERTGLNRRGIYRFLAALRAVGLTPLRTRVGPSVMWSLRWEDVERWFRKSPEKSPVWVALGVGKVDVET